MKRTLCSIAAGFTMLAVLAPVPARAVPYEDRPAGIRALYTAAAMVANVLPVASAFVSPRCLPGYVLCKLSFAGLSVVAAAESLVMSGGADKEEPATLLNRGFSGDWFLTGRHVAGDVAADPFPPAETAAR